MVLRSGIDRTEGGFARSGRQSHIGNATSHVHPSITIDSSFRVVKEKSAVNKSMLASKNLPKPITKAAEGQHWLRVLAAELALRLNEAREADPALWPKTIVLHIRKGEMLHCT